MRTFRPPGCAARRVAVLAAALAVLGMVGTSPIAAHPAGPSAGKIPVVACRTSSPLGKQAARYPARMSLHSTAAVRGQLAFYTDKDRSLSPILGPRGWACSVQLGEDGSGEIDVRPVGGGPNSTIAVTAGTAGACQLCVYDAVCRLIPGSGHQLGASSQPCNEKIPKREHDRFLRRSKHYDVIRFWDPAHVSGTGAPSGDGVRARGLLLYSFHHDQGGAASAVTCTVHQGTRSLCATILGRFRTDHWRVG